MPETVIDYLVSHPKLVFAAINFVVTHANVQTPTFYGYMLGSCFIGGYAVYTAIRDVETAGPVSAPNSFSFCQQVVLLVLLVLALVVIHTYNVLHCLNGI